MTQPATHLPDSQRACPKCGSHDAKYLNVVHEAGLSAVNTQSRGAGCSPLSIILFPLIGFWSLLFSSFGRANTTGTVQTASSIKAAPPQRKPVAFSVLLVLAGLFAMNSSAFFGLVLVVIGGLSLYTAWTFNSRVFPYQYQVWEQSAMCQRCGTIFVPDASRITLEAVTAKQIMGEQGRKLVVATQPILTRAQEVGGQVAEKAAQKAEEIKVAAQREMAEREMSQRGTDTAHPRPEQRKEDRS